MRHFISEKSVDIRIVQILLMLSLLAGGAFLRDFSLSSLQIGCTFAAGIAAQAYFIWRFKVPKIGYLSAVITCIGVSLLLRSDNLWTHPLCVVLAIASKFAFRVNGKHLFNPGNFGVILGISLLPGAWVSAGQWGSDVAFAFWFMALGSIGVAKVRSGCSTWSFILSYSAIWIVHRVFYLGYEWSVFFHQLKSGSFLLFAFFMISDPRTTPNHSVGKVIYAAVVAALAYFIQYDLFFRNGALWALFLLSPLVPLLDKFFISEPFEWRKTGGKRNEQRSYQLETISSGAVPNIGTYIH